MTRVFSTSAGAVAFALLASTSASALTADDLWAHLQKQYTSYGYAITTGSNARAGDTLTLSDVVLTHKQNATLPENKGKIETNSSFTIPEITMKEQADGSVALSLAPEMTIHTESVPPDGKPVKVDMAIRQDGLLNVVSGTPDALTYKQTANSVTIALQDTSKGDTPEPVTLEVTFQGVTSNYTTTTDSAGEKQTGDMAIQSVSYTASGTNIETANEAGTDGEASPQHGDKFSMSGQIANLTGNADMTLPAGIDMSDLGVALGKGAAFAFNLNLGASSSAFSSDSAEKPMKFTSTSDSGTFAAKMSSDGMSFSTTAGKSNIQLIQAPEPTIPTPVSVDVDETAFTFGFPVAQSDAPQPFVGKVKLLGLKVSENIWAMIDPKGKLMHDPAQLELDLGGQAQMTADLFAPSTMAATAPPVQFDKIDINKVHLAIGGADLSGDGTVTVDNASPTPVPAGNVNLSLTGANRLMDGLVSIGLVTKDQAMMGRMMLGLYAVPSGSDAYTSKIEMTPTGEVLANGQRIR